MTGFLMRLCSMTLRLAIDLVAIAPAVACAEESPTSPDQQTAISIPNWICGREYENHAWGYTRSGAVIDGQGRILSYQYSGSPPKFHSGDDYTEEELATRFEGAKPTEKSIPREELARILPLIGEASEGKMSEPKREGADMGSTTLYCLLHDSEKARYREIPLVYSGDASSERDSESAKKLVGWLRASGF